MGRQLSISDLGLDLIKTFEGFRAEERRLVTGQRVIGYGHRVYGDSLPNMTEEEAEAQLKADLITIEKAVNEEVYAPLTQSQFDALCSLAFNIGLKPFRTCQVLQALNNGRVLDAANGFDVWRMATIGGRTYVVDALVRRRTAEKALFLKTDPILPAGGASLPPSEDLSIGSFRDDPFPV